MDERHWWMVSKISENLRISEKVPSDDAVFGDFLNETDRLEMVSQFYSQDGPSRLFIYRVTSGNKNVGRMGMVSSLSDLKDVVLENTTTLYFFRPSVGNEVEMATIEHDIHCGVLKGNVVENLQFLLQEIFMPILKVQRKGHNPESHGALLQQLRKSANALTPDPSFVTNRAKPVTLRMPDSALALDFKHRINDSDQQMIKDYEEILNSWIITIENVLADMPNDRLVDPSAGPISELHRQKRRLRLLTSITEQLKMRESKSLVAVIIMAKSKLMKKWKHIDLSLTDALNDTKDKIKFLESIERSLERLYGAITPSVVMETVLPGLVKALKDCDSVSRFYARQGYLGLLLVKVTNQLAQLCRDYVEDLLSSGSSFSDQLWERLWAEVVDLKEESLTGRPERLVKQNSLSSRVKAKVGRMRQQKMRSEEVKNDGLIIRLFSCLQLQSFYADLLRSLRQHFLSSHNVSHFTSVSSGINAATSSNSQTNWAKVLNETKTSDAVSVVSTSTGSTQSVDFDSPGVALTDEETIMSAMNQLCERFKKTVDAWRTLSQFHKMRKEVCFFPRPRLDDPHLEPETVTRRQSITKPESSPDHLNVLPMDSGNLHMTQEEDNSIEKSDMSRETVQNHSDDPLNKGPSAGDIEVLRIYYPASQEFDEGPRVSDVFHEFFERLTSLIRSGLTLKSLLELGNVDFNNLMSHFFSEVADLEAFLMAYLNAVIVKSFRIQDALSVLTRFASVQNRLAFSGNVMDKYVSVFLWYEEELERLRDTYEQQKENPPLGWNAPQVGGAIAWARQLLRKIEEPMRIFRNCKAVSGMREYGRVVKLYNQFGKALVTYESLWMSRWKHCVDSALEGLKVPLFIIQPDTRELVVNEDSRILELIQEAKWLQKLEVELPDSAYHILCQESRFKHYRDQLCQSVMDYKSVSDHIPPMLRVLFEERVKDAFQNFLPGINRFSWNSTNIDVFLHQINSGITCLKNLVESVNALIANGILSSIESIRHTLLFDNDLAVSHHWLPVNFAEAMKQSIVVQSALLKSHLSNIVLAVNECVSLINDKQEETSGTGRRSWTRLHDQQVASFLDLYRKDIDDAVIASTLSSLNTLANLCESRILPQSRTLSAIIREASKVSPDGSRLESKRVSVAESGDEEFVGRQKLRFELKIRFSLPTITVEPDLDVVKNSLKNVADEMVAVAKVLVSGSRDVLQSAVEESLEEIYGISEGLQPALTSLLQNFSVYEFLWRDDVIGNFQEFVHLNHDTCVIAREVERLLAIENQVMVLPPVLHCGAICLVTHPLKETLIGFATAWKNLYAAVLMEEAKRLKDTEVDYRNSVYQKLHKEIVTLDQLNDTVNLLEEIQDMENKIDGVYRPIEELYMRIRVFEPRLSRKCSEEVDQLRNNWQQLLALAGQVYVNLIREKRGIYEQELDKQVKIFMVEVIQFRNSFDSQGPSIPGIEPAEAVSRLADFQKRYEVYETKCNTINSISKLFSIPCKPFPELVHTGEELKLLGLLYTLYQKFLDFSNSFRECLWADVDLNESSEEVGGYWLECQGLPNKLKEWEAFITLRNSIAQYKQIIPILKQLSFKEIRSRHWMKVMRLTGSSFQLEANVFKLADLLDIELIKYSDQIEEICKSARHELELETQLHAIEDEWTEQVLTFDEYKDLGHVCLSLEPAEHLLSHLEDSRTMLATMLTSRYIGPLRKEVAGWARKLKDVQERLDCWLEAQGLWSNIQAIFATPGIQKLLQQESKVFRALDESWKKMMLKAYETQNAIQCCFMEGSGTQSFFNQILEDLEVCFKMLSGYLNRRRVIFPRFHFVSDATLLKILSGADYLESVRPHLRSFFSAITDIGLEIRGEKDEGQNDDDAVDEVAENEEDEEENDDDDSRKRAALEVFAVSVSSQDGDNLRLTREVAMSGGVDAWLASIKESVSVSLRVQMRQLMDDITNGVSCDEWAQKYPAQICCVGFLYQWTRDCEQAMVDARSDRSTLLVIYRKAIANLNALLGAKYRDFWKNSNVRVTQWQKLRIEAVTVQAILLRDLTENFSRGKIKEVTDFEWRRNLRLYLNNKNGGSEVHLSILDERFPFGSEFYSGGQLCGYTPITDKCVISMVLAVTSLKGCAVVGESYAGKTETVKNFAMITGHHLTWFSCTMTSDPLAISRQIQGAAMDGCWNCMDNVHLLQRQALKTLIDNVQCVMDALRSTLKSCICPMAGQIPIKRGFSSFLTYERDSELMRSMLPDVCAQFREVSLLHPDVSMVLLLNCSRLGLKAPSLVASKLKQVSELIRDQLPPQVHHNISLQSLILVVHCAAQRKRLMRSGMAGVNRTGRASNSGRRNLRLRKSSRTANSVPKEDPKTSSSCPMTSVSLAKSETSLSRKTSSRRFSSKPLSANIQNEHSLIGQLLIEIVGPRFSTEHNAIFCQVVKDFFPGVLDTSNFLQSFAATVDGFDLESNLEMAAKERCLVPFRSWNQKCIQLYSLSLIYTGVVVAGSPCSGKSSIVRTLVEALDRGCRSLEKQPGAGDGEGKRSYKLQKFFPMASDSLDIIFGRLDENRDWKDGIFTSVWKKAAKNPKTLSWLCMDGPLVPNWTDQIACVLDGTKALSLSNGDLLPLTPNIKIIFETDNLSNASPGFLARTGILYVDQGVVGWRPVANAWLDTRTKQEVNVLERAFEKTIDSVWQFVSGECRARLPLSEVNLFTSCVNVLSAMLADNREIGGDVHIERLFLFCLMWTFGGLLDLVERKGLSDLLMTLSNALPDDDQTICIFDYYVDEGGDWDPWQSKLPNVSFGNSWDLTGDVFIDTIDTIRVKMLANFALASGQSVLLVGPTGSGKTSLASDLLNSRDPEAVVVMEMVASGATSAQQMQQFIESNIHHRQGYTYGGKDGKALMLFINDVNLPRDKECNVPRCSELLRRILDEQLIVCTSKKPFEHRVVEDMTMVATMNLSNQPSLTQTLPSSRLMRHFAVFELPLPDDHTLSAMIYNLLEANLLFGEHDCLDIDLHNSIVSGSVALLKTVTNTLRPSSLPGRQHYLFSLKDIGACFQTFKILADESRAEESIMVSLWIHEMNRVFRDRLCRHGDIQWFDETLSTIVKERWPEFANSVEQLYVTFSINPEDYNRPNAFYLKKKAKQQGILQAVDSLEPVHACLSAYLNNFNSEFNNTSLDVQLTDSAIVHVMRIHRMLRGNALLIRSIGSNVNSLVRLALHVAAIPIHRVDSSRKAAFFDGLRSALRLAGTEDKRLALVLSEDDLVDEEYVDAIHSILVTGIYPHLFTNDEMDGLLLALVPVIRKEYRKEKIDAYALLLSRIKTNLHIIISLPPYHRLLSTAIRDFPALLAGCQIMWLCDWSEDMLLAEAQHSVASSPLATSLCDSSVIDSLARTFANIHSHMLTYCNQTQYAGMQKDTVLDRTGQMKRKEAVKQLPNRPLSKTILHENIKNLQRSSEIGRNEVFVGPSLFQRFIDTFFRLFSCKEKEWKRKFSRLKNALETLSTISKDLRAVRDSLKAKTKDFEAAEKAASDLQRALTTTSTKLEKLKASLGQSSSLSAYLQLSEVIIEDEKEDELLKPEARDEYDDEFDRMRKASLKSRQDKAKEELSDVVQSVELLRKNLANAKEQILRWKSRVNRQCIEKLKSAQNPTVLVGSIIEMGMILIGKRLPGQRLDLRSGLDSSYPSRDEQSGKFSISSGSTRVTTANVRRAKPLMKDGMGDRFDHQQWKVMQRIMSDTIRFVELLHGIPWEDGIAPEVIAAVESYLARGPEGQLGVVGDGSQTDSLPERGLRPTYQSPSPDNAKGITIAAAKFSSEDAATLVQYIIAIIEYVQVSGPLAVALRKQRDLESEIADAEKQNLEKRMEEERVNEQQSSEVFEESSGCEHLEELQKHLTQLQDQLDLALVHKNNLRKELETMTNRLHVAMATIESLKSHEAEWSEFVKLYGKSDALVANCVLAAAFLTYCGSLAADARKQTMEFFLSICAHHSLPLSPRVLFKDLHLIDFLFPPTKRLELKEQRLSSTSPLMLDNACFILQGVDVMSWHLICDTTRESIEWLRRVIGHHQTLTIIKYPDARPTLDTCLAEGRPLLVTDVDVASILSDPNYKVVLLSRSKFGPGQLPVKLRVGDHEVECNPGFRLYLHTSTPVQLVPAQLAASVSLLSFYQKRQDVEEHLLDHFLRQEKARLADELISLSKEQREQMSAMIAIDDQMAEILSDNTDLLSNVPLCKKLSAMKKDYEEAKETRLKAESAERHLLVDRESYRPIATRGSICWETMMHLRELNPLYQTSFQQFLTIFRIATSHSERVSQKCLMEQIMSGSYASVSRFLLENDKNVYRLLLAIEMEEASGRVGIGEREFLISPILGSVTMTALRIVQGPSSTVAQAKKPFDWMLDEQFNSLQLLAIHYKWFEEMFDHMARDGRETHWRTLCESEQPEVQPLPEGMDDLLTPLQRMLIIRAVRSDRLLQLAAIFIASVLDRGYCFDMSLDPVSLVKQSSPSTPVLVLYTSEMNSAESFVRDYAENRGIELLTMTLGNSSTDEDETNIKDLAKEATSEGMWLLLRKGHSAVEILDRLDSLLAATDHTNSQFRCWVTAQATDSLTSFTRQTFVKVLLDDTKTIKDTLIRSFAYIDAKDILKQSSRKEWPTVLHNLCYLHGAIHLRQRLGFAGWNSPVSLANIGAEQLHESFKMAATKFQDNPLFTSSGACIQQRISPWAELRFMISEVVYGKCVSSCQDQQILRAMIEYWISPFAVRKDFELPKLKYKVSPFFFSPSPRSSQLMQSLENIGNYQLELPEACNMHSSAETLLGDDQYVFTRLNHIYDVMPSSGSLTHELFVQPPPPCKDLLQANISTSSNNISVVGKSIFSTSSYVSYHMKKEVDLYDLCSMMLKQLPKSYTKESVLEKIRKIGGMTSFNLFIMKEIDLMTELLNEIRTTLQAIKTACEMTTMGDSLSPEHLEAASDLYHHRIPGNWRRLAGHTAPPVNLSVASWLTELNSRCQHFDRILYLGRERTPSYWLGAFFYPRGLLALLRQDCGRLQASMKNGNVEQLVFQTEITARDKDHIRDPPSEGMFIFGIYLWGCLYDKTASELLDTPPRPTNPMLPVIHVTCWPRSEKPLLQETVAKASGELYSCPVYHSRCHREPVLELDLSHSGIPASRWTLRGLFGTIRPY